jgi:polysaccharide biosynthesis protein PslG
MRAARMCAVDRIGGKGAGPYRRALRVRRPSRRARLVVVAVLAILVPLVSAGGASASVPRSFFGAVPWISFEGPDFQRLAEAKIHNTRTPFYWPTIQPGPHQFSWAATDEFVGKLAPYHVRVLPFLNGAPSWVTHSNNPRKPPLSSKKARKRWKSFVKACVARYGRNGVFWDTHPNIPKVPITTWQIWNEPNNYKYFAPKAKPKKYAKLVKLAAHAARSKDRHAKIVLAGMDSDPTGKKSITSKKFLGKVYKSKGAKRSFNAVAVHPYAPTIRNLKKQMNALRKVIKRNHDNAKMWITEMGWGSAPPEKRWPLLKGVKGQKKILKKSYRVLIHNRKHWRLQRVYWFMWRDAAPDDEVNCSFCTSAGLFTHDFKPKPSWNAFLRITRR